MFLDPTHPLLGQRATEVAVHEIPLPATQSIIERMFEAAHGERTEEQPAAEKRPLVGLSAPQIGISKRIILVDMAVQSERNRFGELQAFINPEILWHSEELLWDREGCFSVDRRIGGVVPRAERIKLIAYDRYGNPIMQEIAGFTARIFQHEIDHLNGILFPDRVGKEGVLHWVEASEFADYKANWQNWKVRCSWDKWTDLKGDGPTYPC
jgi:peptide deformylase